MKFIITIYANIFLLLNIAMAHKEPAQVSGLVMYDDSRPLEVHVFCSLPLLQENFEMDFLGIDLYHEKQAEQIKNFILDRKDKFIKFYDKNEPLPIFIKEVQLTYDENDEELPPGLHFTKDVDINIVLLFSTPQNAEELTGTWQIFPDTLLDLEKEYGGAPSPKSYEIALTYVAEETKTFKNSSAKPSFTWKNSDNQTNEPQAQVVTKSESINKHFEYSLKTAFAGGLLIFLYWVFSNDTRASKPICLLAAINLAAYIYMTDFNETKTYEVTVLPEKNELKTILKNRLTTVYNTLSKKQKNKVYDQLANATSGKFLDQTYQDLHKSIFVNTDILKIVDKIDISNIEKLSDNSVRCSWSIQALIRHKNHIHSKNLQFSAEFTFKYSNDKWLISKGHILPIHELAQQ